MVENHLALPAAAVGQSAQAAAPGEQSGRKQGEENDPESHNCPQRLPKENAAVDLGYRCNAGQHHRVVKLGPHAVHE